MNKIFTRIVNSLIDNGNIQKEDAEVYIFTLNSIVILGCNIITSIIIGFLLEVPLYCMVFLLAVIFIRSYAGGYHASNYVVCFIMSYIVLVSVLLFIKYINLEKIEDVFSFIAVVSGVLLLRFAPLTDANRTLTIREKTEIGKRARWITIIELFTGLLFIKLNIKMGYSILFSVIVCAMGYLFYWIKNSFISLIN